MTAATATIPLPTAASAPSEAVALGGKRVATLDGLRGLAVLLVLAHHFVALSPLLDGPLGSVRSYVRQALLLPTQSGVDLFFVLSGFLVGGILLTHRGSPNLVRTFYLRRFLRIMPLAWLCVATVVVMQAAGWTTSSATALPFWVHGSFATNLHLAAANHWVSDPLVQLWSVAVEEQFYLTLPWIVLLWPKPALAWLAPALIAGAWISRAAIFIFAPDHLFACHLLTPCRFDAFGLGLAAVWLVRSAHWSRWQSLGARRWLALIPPGLGFTALVKLHAFEGDPAMASWGYTAVAGFFAVLLLLVYESAERWVRVLFGSGFLRLFGRYSYFVYLFQGLLVPPLVALLLHGDVHAAVLARWWELLLVPGLILIPAWLSWRLIEQPLLRIGHRTGY